MDQLQQAVNDAFSRVIASGAIEKAIEQNLEETITGMVREHLRPYSEFSKALKEHVSKALNVDLTRLDLPSYGQLILNIVRRKVEADADASIARTVQQQLEKLLEGAPAEIRLSELVRQFIEEYREDDHRRGGSDRITLIVDPSQYGSRWVYLDAREGRDKYECAFRFGVVDGEGDGKIFGLAIERREVEKTLLIGPLYRFERSIYQMYAAGTRLVIDEDAVETYYPGCD